MPAGDQRMLRSDEIDETFVPRRRDDVVFVELEGELVVTVLIEGTRDEQFDSHWLDRSASIIWNCFDGYASLGELADDLSDAFSTDRDVVSKDVIALTRHLGRSGLLDGVVAERPEAGPGRAGGVPVGTPVPAFRFVDLDEREFSSETSRGRRMLVVNWSPGCGYCGQIAGDLAAASSGLDAGGIDLVLMALGSAEENRHLVEEAGLACTVVRNDGFELFEGLGTPVACIVDETGCVASEFAFGSVEVMELARRAAGHDEES